MIKNILPNGNSVAMEAIIDAMAEIRSMEESRQKNTLFNKLEEAYLLLKEFENYGIKN